MNSQAGVRVGEEKERGGGADDMTEKGKEEEVNMQRNRKKNNNASKSKRMSDRRAGAAVGEEMRAFRHSPSHSAHYLRAPLSTSIPARIIR